MNTIGLAANFQFVSRGYSTWKDLNTCTVHLSLTCEGVFSLLMIPNPQNNIYKSLAIFLRTCPGKTSFLFAVIQLIQR